MKRDPQALGRQKFDLLVIGGGISGACVAWDAVLRGLSVALVEKGDFGEATSSASSKLIHGGVRYLQQGAFGKVRESIEERRAFLRVAPHLVHPVPFLIPTYKGVAKGRALLSAGMTVYDLIGFDRNRGLELERKLPGFQVLTKEEALEREPLLAREDLTGAVSYPECQMYSSERMTLSFVENAARHGAQVANYCEVTGLLTDRDRVTGARVRDRLTSDEIEIRAELVANVSGPWAFHLIDKLKGRDVAVRMKHSRGCHLVTAPLTNGHALALATRMKNEAIINRGGRHIFLIPWRGRTLIGTTNVSFDGSPDEQRVVASDVDDFLTEINTAIPGQSLTRDDVEYAFSGLYPLVDTDVKTEVYQGSGKYLLYDHEETDSVPGMITAIGAKFTTARRLAERTVDLAFRKLGRPTPPCETAHTVLDGGDVGSTKQYVERETKRSPESLDADTVEDLVFQHGTRFRSVLGPTKSNAALREKLTRERPTIRSSIVHAAREEMAVSLADVMFRRTGLGTVGHPGRECLEECASLLGEELSWTEEKRRAEIESVEDFFGRMS